MMKLTDTLLKRQKASDTHRDLSDEGTPLSARIKANGDIIFIWRGRIGGKQTKKIIGEYPAMSVVQARAAALAMKDEAKTVVATPKVLAEPRFMTVSKAFNRYMKEHGDHLRSASTLKGMMELRIIPEFGARDLKTLTRKELNDHFNKIRPEYRGTGINHLLAYTKAFLNWCVRQDLLDTNPAAMIDKKAKLVIRKRVLKDHELGYLQMALAKMDAYHAPLSILLHTGCRLSDIFCLTWKDVCKKLDGDGYELLIANTKADVPHIAHLTKQASAFLPAKPANAKFTDFVFPDISRTRGSSYLTKLRKLTNEFAAKDKREIEHFTIHDFRTAISTYISDQVGRGNHRFTDRAIDMLLAHVPKGVTKRNYNHSACLDEREEMLTIWSNYLDKCAKMVQK